MDKIKILQFPIANSNGGITHYAINNWKWMNKNKFHCDFATMSKKLEFASELEHEGCKIYYISCYAEEDDKKFSNEFKKILSEGKYDIVHLHTKQWKSFRVEQLAKEAGVKKIIIHAHSTGIDTLDKIKREHEQELHNQILQQLTEEMATDYWACSLEAAKFVFGRQIPEYRIKIIRNAIDVSKFNYNVKSREEYREKFGIKDEIVVGNVGRFVFQKNQDFLFNVISEIGKSVHTGKKYKLLLVGTGEREEEYKQIIRKNNLEKEVIFAGQRTDIAELLSAMDIFCLPSKFEGAPISLIEALASGLPCIVSEFVPVEKGLCVPLITLPLNVTLWKEKIIEYTEYEYNRERAWKHMGNMGYDIGKQIRYVEKEYMSGL